MSKKTLYHPESDTYIEVEEPDVERHLIAGCTEPAHVVVATPAMPVYAVVANQELIARVGEREQALIDAPAIVDQTTLTAVQKVVKAAKTVWNDLEACRQRVKAPYLDACTKIDAAAKPLLARLQDVMDEGKHQQGTYLNARNAQLRADELARQAAEITAALDTSRPTAPLVAMNVPDPIAAPLQRRPRVELVNAQLLPREYLIPDMARITQDALAGKVIPGVTVHQESIVVVR